MATPAKYQGSTPKSALVATPQNAMSSPFPAHSVAKGFAGKSPAMKTPSTVGHSHQHNLSTSSHPSSTPLAALLAGEEAMAFNSPSTAAAIAQLGGRGLTPLGGHDGLGIAGEGLALKEPALPMTRNAEEEWLQRLRKAIEDLQPRVTGRGVCREGVENVAQLAGFQPLWQENVLTIAGDHLVDLEIEFETERPHIVRDVSLKIGQSGANQAASEVIKRNLVQSADDRISSPFKSLEAFSRNLERLAALDRLSQDVDCFKALDGLYESFQKIWKETKKRRPDVPDSRLQSSGPIGRPFMHKGNDIGLGIDYWAEKSRLGETKLAPIDEAPDETSGSSSRHSQAWIARFECEAGYPSIQISNSWVSEEVLASGSTDTDNPEVYELQAAWLDEPLPDADSMALDEQSKVPKTPNVRFVFTLEPPVQIPGTVAASIFEQAPTLWQQRPPQSYESLIQESLRVATTSEPASSFSTEQSKTSNSWMKEVLFARDDGTLHTKICEYRLRSEQTMNCYSVDEIPFSHPRQVLVHLPVFRQYARVWTLVRSVAEQPLFAKKQAHRASENPSIRGLHSKTNSFRKSNRNNSSYAKLSTILDGDAKNQSHSSITKMQESPQTIDIALRLSGSAHQNPCIDMYFTHRQQASPDKGTKSSCIVVEVLPNGELTIPVVQNLASLESEPARNKMSRILDISEDLSMLLAWVLQRVP